MKKILFYSLFIGNELTPKSTIKNRINLAKNQLTYLNKFINKQNKFSSIFIIPTLPSESDNDLTDLCKLFKFEIFENKFIRKNNYEYAAFNAMKKIQDLTEEEMLFFYCHSKGLGNPRPLSQGIFKVHIQSLLEKNITPYFSDPNIKKIGLFPSKNGWLWHNFFWVNSNVFNNKRIELSERRHYYETLIGEKDNPLAFKNCLPFLSEKIVGENFQPKEFYTAEEINRNSTLIKTFKKFS